MASESAQDLQTADHFIYVTQVYFCAMYAVVLWDWIISLPREYRFVWRTRWTAVKIAYLFCRYWVITVVPYLLYCFVADHSLETCQRIYKIPVALAMWNQVGSESVLLIRTYAFFSRNIYVLCFLVSALSGVVAYQLYVDTTQMLLLPFYKPPFENGPCFPMSKPHSAHLLGFFIAPLLFDTVVTFMTVWKAFNIRRRNGSPNSRLIQTFLREGVFYYILISIANLINGVFYLQPRQVISAINIPLSVMLGPVFACRLILDLRERGSETVSHSEGTGIAAFTTKSMTQHGSPYTPPGHRTKNRSRGVVSTINSNVVLTTLGSIHPHHMDIDFERDVVEMEEIRLGLGMDLGSLSTAIGGDDGEPLPESEGHRGRHRGSPAPAYHSLEMGFQQGGEISSSTPSVEAQSIAHSIVSGIRVDVEQATSST
ncbi:hypothetical protein HYPSUDRAFT_697811 [Hypholoma sublateritium FD-334 SS-4]|uniref:DUF6533 domain-containing protein n=1 Tax=Hypholoma sublateritium (strain FD-334 SS-4) TaxID=945553 RepID=A0A0D2MWI3_HYPSF|nr:hypothetical protein HYPSUDRAFT_697811 [Hypholoma sublateritium FD-334 SS-4]